MKKPSDELFRLIRSLSPSEKRYFKVVTAHREGEPANSYHKLFDAIDEQEHYDEAALLAQHKGQKFTRNFSMVKKYLTESIIKSLCSFYPAKHRDIDVFEKLHAAKLMDEKGLFSLRDKLIKSARSIATGSENVAALLHVVRVESINRFSSVRDNNPEEHRRLYDEQQELLAMLRTDIDLSYLHGLSHALLKQIGTARSDEERNELWNLLDQPVLRDQSQLKTLIHQQMFHNIRSRCFHALGDYAQSHHHFRLCVEAYESKPEVVEKNPVFYGRLLHNFANCCINADEWDDHYATIRKLRALPAPDNDRRMRKVKFESLYIHELHRYWALGEVEAVYEILPQIEAVFAEQGAAIEAQMYLQLFHQVVKHLFALQDYEAALDYAHRLLDDDKLHGPLIFSVRIIMILIHQELRNFDVADSSIRSLRRQLRKQDAVPQVEVCFLKACAKVGGLSDREEELSFFRKLKAELEAIISDPQEAQTLNYFDFTAWVDARIQGVSIAEVIKQRSSIKSGTKPA